MMNELIEVFTDQLRAVQTDYRRNRHDFANFSRKAVCVLLLLQQVHPCHARSGCQVETCANSFTEKLHRDKVLVGDNARYCAVIQDYSTCLQGTSRPCRGVLKYHSLVTLLRQQLHQYQCKRVLAAEALGRQLNQHKHRHSNNNSPKSARNTPKEPKCRFPFKASNQHETVNIDETSKNQYRVCQMFGDPHLRTFEGQYSTCISEGAWPLVDNSYFAVQITNEKINPFLSPATYISKITVLIKQLSGCTTQRLYEASGNDISLPSSFQDGFRRSGQSEDSILAIDADQNFYGMSDSRIPASSERVVLNLSYISTRIIIRRHGRHLSVIVRMPEQILLEQTQVDSGQLCLAGCAVRDTVALESALSSPHQFLNCYKLAQQRRRRNFSNLDQELATERSEALRLCREYRLSDFYLDACVFDMMFHGDFSLRDAARAALTDLQVLHAPYGRKLAQNRTDLPIYEYFTSSENELSAANSMQTCENLNFRDENMDFSDDQMKQHNELVQRILREKDQAFNASQTVNRSLCIYALLFLIFVINLMDR